MAKLWICSEAVEALLGHAKKTLGRLDLVARVERKMIDQVALDLRLLENPRLHFLRRVRARFNPSARMCFQSFAVMGVDWPLSIA